MALTGKAQIANVNSFYDRKMLYRAQSFLVHQRWAQVNDIPEGNSDVIKMRRYTNLTAATTPLTEGVTPTGSQLAVTTISATVQQYGDFILTSDKLNMETEDPIRDQQTELLGYQAGLTLDTLTRDILNAGTNVIFGGSGHTLRTQVAAGEIITTAMIISAVKTLKVANALFITSFVDPTTGVATIPLAPCFIGIVHPNITPTLEAMTGWTKVELYANAGARMENEIGKYSNVRFVESTNAKVFTGGGASSIDVYSTVIFGQWAYGTSRISGNAMRQIVKPLGSAGTADPLDQRTTYGWKATFVAKILNDDFMVRLEYAGV